MNIGRSDLNEQTGDMGIEEGRKEVKSQEAKRANGGETLRYPTTGPGRQSPYKAMAIKTDQ